jgi:hypothetical protein
MARSGRSKTGCSGRNEIGLIGTNGEEYAEDMADCGEIMSRSCCTCTILGWQTLNDFVTLKSDRHLPSAQRLLTLHEVPQSLLLIVGPGSLPNHLFVCVYHMFVCDSSFLQHLSVLHVDLSPLAHLHLGNTHLGFSVMTAGRKA